MTRHKFSKRFLMLSAALTMLLSQSAFAGEVVELNLEDAMQRAFNTNPAITIAGYERDSARATYNAARSSRWITIEGNHVTKRGGYDDDQYSALVGRLLVEVLHMFLPKTWASKLVIPIPIP